MGRVHISLALIVCLLAVAGLTAGLYEKEKQFWVWPKPGLSSIGSQASWLDEYNFNFHTTKNSFTHDILKQAFKRYQGFLKANKGVMQIIDYPAMPEKPNAPLSNQLRSLEVTVTTKVATLALGVDESYGLHIEGSTATLQAETIFGALRGLETFAQLVQWNGTVMLVPYTPIDVSDAPQWPWRGMLIDTARHYQTIENLEAIIDAMSYAKLNVFHWHLTDAESFPIVLPSVPEFAEKGAYNAKATYTKKDVAYITKYALYRGIRVVPEIDTPGHTYSFGKAHPEMIVECSQVITKKGYPGINNVALNLTNPEIYPLLRNIYGDVADMFSDEYLHAGGDEVRPACFDEFPEIAIWMGAHGMDNTTVGPEKYVPLLRDFRLQLTPMITSKGKKMVLWQEALEEMLVLGPNNPLSPSNTVVHLWINDDWQTLLNTSLQRGYPTLLSSGWYLDQQVPNPKAHVPGTDPVNGYIYQNQTHYLDIDTWLDMYAINPLGGLDLSVEQRELFLGGEVAQWAEAITGLGILTNIWPRAAAVAERLWDGDHSFDAQAAYHRLIRFQCYLYQRGVPTSGLRPNYCFSAVLNPPYLAGGLTLHMPVWGLILLLSAILVLIIISIVLAVKLYNANKKIPKEDGFDPIEPTDE
jgi:hexosaminidase